MERVDQPNGRSLQAVAVCYVSAMSRRTWLLAFAIVAIAAAVLFAMGRNPICACGTVELWVPQRDSPKTSQMLADWYSLSHVVHGLLFYAMFWLAGRRWPVEFRLLGALLVETSWEVIENTPFVIDRYRSTTAALGYTGDSIVNSLSDIMMMGLGFVAARKLPVWTSIVLLLVLEVVPLFVIRDDLALNILALLRPSKLIQAWQTGG